MPAFTRPALLAFIVQLAACSNGVTDASGGSDPTAAVPPPPNLCTDPRPQICTQEYIGVCATLTDGSTRTMATGCTACSDPDVVGWQLGECD